MDLLEHIIHSEWLAITFKVLVSALLGSIVGLERESHGQAAGLRTFILVATGSCLMMQVSLYLAEPYKHLGAQSSVRIDPGRVASYALAGMGFLGAGAIITGKGSVRGLTTAAGMWLTTGVGLSVGAGFYFPAILVTLVSYVVLYILRHARPFVRRDRYVQVSITKEGLKDSLQELEFTIKNTLDAKIQWRRYEVSVLEGKSTYTFVLLGKEDEDWHLLVERVKGIPDVLGVTLTEGRVS